MNPTPQATLTRRFLLALTLGLATAPAVWSQTTTAAPDDPAAEKKPVPVTVDAAKTLDEKVVLSPFVVTESNNGYRASNTMSGTRLNSKISDLASSISVITKQQLVDTAAVDINDIFKNEANTEGIYQYTEWAQDRGFTIDTVAQNPNGANRIRGATQANIANGNFVSATPVDAYNVDAVEISRGPNSNIFGLGGAGGTVNVITGNANLTRDITQVVFRMDSYGGKRSTWDLNRPIWKDKLAIRVQGLYEEKGFERQPAYEKINRLTGSFTFHPFKNTTLKGSFESYRNFNNRSNSVTPRDSITDWKAAGSPVWDPTFNAGVGGWRLLGGSTYTSTPIGTQGSGALAFPVGIQNDGTGFYNRALLAIDNGQFAFWSINRSTTTVGSPGAANGISRYAQIAGVYQRTNYIDNNGLFHNLMPLYQQPGVSNIALYDWTSVNFAAPNFGTEKADNAKVELEQWFLETERHVLALQLGWYRESIDRYSRAWVGNTDGAPPNISLDINEKLLNGAPNPRFLHPYIATSEVQAFRRPEENDNYRATLAYQLDFSKESGWQKWLGRHRIAGYGEYRESRTVSNQFRYRDQMVTGPYINATNLSASGNITHFASRYYLGGDIRDAGPVIDYNARWLDYNGAYDFTWWQPDGTQVVDKNVKIGEVFFSTQNPQKKEIRTKGFIVQSFFWEDRIIPTYGVRMDHVNSVLGDNVGGDSILNSVTAIADPRFSFKDGRGPVNKNGRTTSKGVVVKVLQRPNLGLDMHYNESDNFLPEGSAYTINQNLLPNPTGNGKDYGFTVSLLNNRLSMKYNHYTTFQKDARNGVTGVLATRPLRIDFDTAPGAAGDSQDLEDSAINWVTQLRYGANTNFNPTFGTTNLNGAISDITGASIIIGNNTATVLTTIDKATAQSIVNEAYTKYMGPGIDTAYVDWVRTSGVTLSDVNDITSKGDEIEISYNPNQYWTMKANITKQNAIDTHISATIGDYINKRIAWWQSINVPTGATPSYVNPTTGATVPAGLLPNSGASWYLFGSGIAGNNGIPRDFYIGNVDAVYTFAVDNAGKRRPQTREYRANFITNYKLAGISDNKFLKNMTVGGTFRWEGKAIIGYQGLPAGSDGIQRYRDVGKPIWDKSRYYIDLNSSYTFRMFHGKVKTRIQLNIENIFEDGRLQAVAVNPDGLPWNFRIIDPRKFILTATFDL